MGHGLGFDFERTGGFVDQVDGFVGEEAFGNVAGREVNSGHQGVVGDADTVVDLVFFFDPAQDGEGVGLGGFSHINWLETAFESLVFFDVFAVFVEGGGADGAHLAAGKGRLENIGCVGCAFATGTD